MPIKPENKHRYPENWPEIRERILRRACWMCEFCHVKNRVWIRRHKITPTFYLLVRSGDKPWQIHNYSPYLGIPCGHTDGHVFDDGPTEMSMQEEHWEKEIRIVLTIAHLDHTPEHCDDNNLRALCQRCHLLYDKEHHAKSRHQKPGQLNLFGGLS